MEASTSKDKFNDIQRKAFTAIIRKIEQDPERAHFFLQGAGRIGKTFLYTVIYAYYRAKGDIVLCVALLGITALLLLGNRTSYSRFKIPLKVYKNSRYYIKY